MPLPREKRYTLADALTWDEPEHIELIYGDEDGRYVAKNFATAKDTVKVSVLENCVIDLSRVFTE